MATREHKRLARPGRQAPTGAWVPANLMAALKSGTRKEKVAAARSAGIIDSAGKITARYRNWGNKVSRTES